MTYADFYIQDEFIPASTSWITTTATTSASELYYISTANTGTVPNITFTYPAIPEEENEVASCDVCHLCKSELVKCNTFQWRVLDCDCDEDEACKCDEYIWKKETVKTYECGTVVRDGDVSEDAKRVTLGKGCIELGA